MTNSDNEALAVENSKESFESLYSNTIVYHFRLIASVTGLIGLPLWAIHWFNTPTLMNICMQFASCWIFWRGYLGQHCKKEIIFGDIVVLLALIFSFEKLPDGLTGMLVNGPFSSQIYIALIAFFLVVTFIDLSKNEFWNAHPSSQKESSRIQFFILLLVIGFFLALVVMPFIANWIDPPKKFSHTLEKATLFEQILLSASKTFSLIWVFLLGASVGSFLNVLIYRMPIGKSVLLEKSHCPKCEYNIQSTDNIPIFGWLRLGGKCRNCSSPISIRYPIVEAIIGFMIVILFSWQTLSGGGNLPVRPQNLYRGFVWIVFYTKWDLILLFLFHAFLFCTLFTWLMIERDKEKVPAFSFWTALLMIFAATFAWPMIIERWRYILPVLFYPESSELIRSIPLIFRNLLSAMAGAMMGGIILSIGLLIGKLFQLKLSLWHSGIFLVLIGSTLGWQAVTTIGVFWIISITILNATNKPLFEQQWKLNATLLIITFTHHLFWKPIYEEVTTKLLPFHGI